MAPPAGDKTCRHPATATAMAMSAKNTAFMAIS
jgi:hypothetical protein